MTTRRKSTRRRCYRQVKDLALPMFLELLIGPSRPSLYAPDGNTLLPVSAEPIAFPDDASRRAIWAEVREDFMAKCARHDSRPWAWWHYESPEPRNEAEHQAEQLGRMGALSDGEGERL